MSATDLVSMSVQELDRLTVIERVLEKRKREGEYLQRNGTDDIARNSE